MKIIVVALITITLSNFAQATSLFILGGQSNASGQGSDAAYYPHDQAADQQIQFYWVDPQLSDSGKWVTMQPQAGIYPLGHFGPEVSLARGALKLLNNDDVAIFKFTSGNTSLYKDWQIGKVMGLFAVFTKRLDAARKELQQQHRGQAIANRCFIWLQGESDAQNDLYSRAYENSLKQLVSIIREKLGTNIRIVLGVDEQHPWVRGNVEVVHIQKTLVAHDHNLRFVSMIGLPKADVTHLTAQGVREHGERLLEACLNK